MKRSFLVLVGVAALSLLSNQANTRLAVDLAKDREATRTNVGQALEQSQRSGTAGTQLLAVVANSAPGRVADQAVRVGHRSHRSHSSHSSHRSGR